MGGLSSHHHYHQWPSQGKEPGRRSSKEGLYSRKAETFWTMSEGGSQDDVAIRTNGSLFRPGITPEEMTAGYDDWAENYDEMLFGKDGFRGPAIILEEALRWVPPERRAKARVLDVAAGTGCVGSELHREGFRHIDAVEPSQGMVKKLRESGVYTNYFVEFIGTGHSSVPKDTYDLVVTSGSMGEGHIPVSGLDDLVRVAKIGGLVIIVMRHDYLQTAPSFKDKLEPYMDQLEADGKWRKVERRTAPNYFFDKEGLVFVFRITKPE